MLRSRSGTNKRPTIARMATPKSSRTTSPNSSTRTSGALGPWRRLSVAFTVPSDVGQAVVLLTVLDQEPDDVTWFDDVRIVRIEG